MKNEVVLNELAPICISFSVKTASHKLVYFKYILHIPVCMFEKWILRQILYSEQLIKNQI